MVSPLAGTHGVLVLKPHPLMMSMASERTWVVINSLRGWDTHTHAHVHTNTHTTHTLELGNIMIIMWNRDIESDDNRTVENFQYRDMILSSMPWLLIWFITQNVQSFHINGVFTIFAHTTFVIAVLLQLTYITFNS